VTRACSAQTAAETSASRAAWRSATALACTPNVPRASARGVDATTTRAHGRVRSSSVVTRPSRSRAQARGDLRVIASAAPSVTTTTSQFSSRASATAVCSDGTRCVGSARAATCEPRPVRRARRRASRPGSATECELVPQPTAGPAPTMRTRSGSRPAPVLNGTSRGRGVVTERAQSQAYRAASAGDSRRRAAGFTRRPRPRRPVRAPTRPASPAPWCRLPDPASPATSRCAAVLPRARRPPGVVPPR
jgi:hypothetical protein